jgi:flagellar L-ring protein precursor FlgH
MNARQSRGMRAWIFIVGIGLSACAGVDTGPRQTGAVGPEALRPPPEVLRAHEGPQATLEASLLQGAPHFGYFQDLRAYQVGDLVTVNIVETSKASKQAGTKTERSSGINAGISNLLGYETKMGKNLPAAFNPEVMFKAAIESDFDGSGTTSRNESMTAFITARVMRVLPNGNLVIEGRREIRVNHEIQYITLSGLIRPADISPDNTVLSSYIADAKIDYTGSGPVSDKQRPGWLGRIIDAVWPF